MCGKIGNDDVVLAGECLGDESVGHGVSHQAVEHDERPGIMPAGFEPVEGMSEVGVDAVDGAQGEIGVGV